MKKKKVKYTSFRPRIRSRHPSHDCLRPEHKKLPLLPFRSVIRLGSSTELRSAVSNGGTRIELNTVEAISNSSNKLKMKQCFTRGDVRTADWYCKSTEGDFFYACFGEAEEDIAVENLPFPIVAKKHYGSRNNGNTKLDTLEEFNTWSENKDLRNYIFEKYYSYTREYRLHVSEDGCFYSCRKMLKSDAPQEVRWYRNDEHCVWILEDNESFDRPVNWTDIENECVKALLSVGLDFGAIDLRVQSATNKRGERREAPEFIVVEINSAPSFGELTEEKYLQVLPELLRKKYNKTNE
jgi:hypothetical protein